MITNLKRKKVLVLTLVAGSLCIALAFLQKEPGCRGHSLSYWVKESNKTPASPEAESAIREIGTNAVPYLLKWLRYEPPAFLSRASSRPGEHHPNMPMKPFARGPFLRVSRFERAESVASAFKILGSQASNAIPALVQVMYDTNRFNDAGRAARSLASLGKEAIPPLVNALKHPNGDVRFVAASVMKDMSYLGTNTASVVPVLIQGMQDPDGRVAFSALISLCQLSTDPSIRRSGTNAWPHIALLRLLMKDPDPRVANAASNAFLKIESSAASPALEK